MRPCFASSVTLMTTKKGILKQKKASFNDLYFDSDERKKFECSRYESYK